VSEAGSQTEAITNVLLVDDEGIARMVVLEYLRHEALAVSRHADVHPDVVL
jgi:hypothetical protein